jgi:hypothetical protein
MKIQMWSVLSHFMLRWREYRPTEPSSPLISSNPASGQYTGHPDDAFRKTSRRFRVYARKICRSRCSFLE